MYKPLRRAWKLAALSTLISIVGYSQPGSGQTKPKVVASYSVLCDLAQQVAQETVDLTCLIEAGEDPHVYRATPSDRRAIEDAQLILYGGYEFEPAIIQLIEATSNAAPKVAVDEVAVPEPLMGEAHEHEQDEAEHENEHENEIAEAHEDEHTEGELEPDPHVWHDAENGEQMVEVIRDSLAEVVPENAELYSRNAQTVISQLDQLNRWIEQQIATIPENQRTLVTTHDALGYYGNAYGLEIEGALGSLSTEASPSAARIREIVGIIQQTDVPTVFAETTNNPRLMETVAREADVSLSEQEIYADSLGEPGTPAASYQGMLMTNTCTIVTGLGGTCDETEAQAFLP